MALFQFGSGVAFLTPQVGDTSANPTPMQLGSISDCDVDFKFDEKMLYGRNQAPDDVAKGKLKIAVKAKFARFQAKLVNDMIFGQTLTTGQFKVSIDETGSVTAGSVTVAQSATFKEDLGVRYAATGLPLAKVGASPAVGQYSVNVSTGVYTFNVSDNGTNNVLISYFYNVAASGQQLLATAQLMGFGPKLSLVLSQQYQAAAQCNLKLFRVVMTNLHRPTKNDDFTVLEMQGAACYDDAGNLFRFDDAA